MNTNLATSKKRQISLRFVIGQTLPWLDRLIIEDKRPLLLLSYRNYWELATALNYLFASTNRKGQTIKLRIRTKITARIHWTRVTCKIRTYRWRRTMTSVSVTNNRVLQRTHPVLTFFEISSLKMKCFTVNCDRKSRVIFVVDTNNRSFESDTSSSYTSDHFFARLKHWTMIFRWVAWWEFRLQLYIRPNGLLYRVTLSKLRSCMDAMILE